MPKKIPSQFEGEGKPNARHFYTNANDKQRNGPTSNRRQRKDSLDKN